ncbi:hypothetical protein BGX27_004449 [Mortierella sp. AM989]|nr:hypothetical protein BGX27_004449 [Mortierella sp. AM989]
MARFTLQRGLDDIHKLRYQKTESSSHAQSPGESSHLRTVDRRYRRPVTSRQQSIQSGLGELSQSQAMKPRQLKLKSSSVSDTPLGSISRTNTPISSASASSGSFSSSSTQEGIFSVEETMPAQFDLMEPHSTDNALAPTSDGGGHEGDVEDEGGPSTLVKSLRERVSHVISEKGRGKQHDKSQPQMSIEGKDRLSCEDEPQDIESRKDTRLSNPSKPTILAWKPLLSTCDSSNLKEQATTACNVGLNGFIPTERWVEGWMRSLRFEPLLVLLQYAIPEIEQIHALNDHQVLEYIEKSLIPKLQHQLPGSGRPAVTVNKLSWDELAVWFQVSLWSQVYLGGGGQLGRRGLGIWYESGIKLLSTQTEQAPTNKTAIGMDSTAIAFTQISGTSDSSSSISSASSSSACTLWCKTPNQASSSTLLPLGFLSESPTTSTAEESICSTHIASK